MVKHEGGEDAKRFFGGGVTMFGRVIVGVKISTPSLDRHTPPPLPSSVSGPPTERQESKW